MRIAIHQPNLFPWLGFFKKILASDKFVFLDHVVVNTKTPNWFKRVYIELNGDKFGYTISLNKPKGSFAPINEVEIHPDQRIQTKSLRTMEQAYRQKPYFNQVFPLVTHWFDSNKKYSERNIAFIVEVCQRLNIKNEFIKSSDLNVHGSSNDLLVSIIKELGGDSYLAGGGSDGYQDDTVFHENNIQVEYQKFNHPVYDQLNSMEFLSGLSILDALMNIGFEGTSNLIVNGK